MKKYYSPTIGIAETKQMSESSKGMSPRPSTIAFLKQFARAYCGSAHSAMPGIVLN